MNAQQQRIEQAALHASLREATPLFFRDSVLIGLVLFGLLAAAIIFFYEKAVDSKIEDAKRLLEGHGKFFAALVDSRLHASLLQPEHSRSPAFQALSSRLQRVREFYPEVGWLFTGRYQNGGALVVIQTEEPHGSGTLEPHYLGQPLGIPASPDDPVWQNLNSGETVLSDKPIFPGHSVGAVIPLGIPYNGARDFLYLDLNDEHFNMPMAALRKLRDIGLFVAALVALGAGMGIFTWRCRIFVAHKEPETALKKSEELFRTTFALSPVAMFIAGPDIFIRRANHAMCEFLDYTETELSERDLRDYSVAEDLKKELPLIEKLRTRELSHYYMEKRFKRKNGAIVWGFVSVAAVRDVNDELSYIMAQVVDITERKVAEDLLRLNEERLALAASAGKVGTWDYDMQNQTIIWNPVMHDIFKTDPKTFAPTFARYTELIHPDDRNEVTKEFQRSVTENVPFNMEFRTLGTNGGMRYVQADALIYRNEAGQPIRAVGTNIDITAEKVESAELTRAKEEAQAADRAKSEFLAVMSHELRTPMNGVLGFISLLKNTPLSPEQRGHIDTIESSGEGLLVLIDDVLDFSKIESGNLRVDVTAFEMRPFLREIYLLLKSRAEEKGISYTYDIDPDVPAMIHTDRVRLGQILSNIVGNAIKFTERGRVQLRLAASPLDHLRKEWEWRFVVQDTGPGIPSSVLPHLFKPFYQGDSSSTRRYGGTGLGLAISRRLAGLLGGDITVQSWNGSGSEFTITLKAPSSQPSALKSYFAQQREKGSGPQPQLPMMKGKRILVVEDNPVNRKLCTLQLTRMGCETDYAETGREAVQKCLDHQFDVVLMDMQLPDLDGCSAAREIRERKKDDPNLRIIALTANAMPEDRQKCLDAGMNDYMSKPFKAETLATTLKKWM